MLNLANNNPAKVNGEVVGTELSHVSSLMVRESNKKAVML